MRTRTLGDLMTSFFPTRAALPRRSPHSRASDVHQRVWTLLGLGTGLALLLPPVHLLTDRSPVPTAATSGQGSAKTADDQPVLLRGPHPAMRAGASDASFASPDPELADRQRAERRLADQLQRARGLAKARNIAQARIVLEEAIRSGDGEALFLFGEMFDPNHLAALGITDLRAEAARARHLYTRALQAGFAPAQARLDQLD